MTLEQVREIEPAGGEVVRGLLRAVASIAAEQYRIDVSRDEVVPQGVTIKLAATDSSREHATVVLHVAENASHVWITVGRGLEMEVPTSKTETWSPTGLGLEAAIEAICFAAVQGNVSENVTFENGIASRSEGTITISDEDTPVVTVRGSPGPRRNRERTTATYDYEPFAQV